MPRPWGASGAATMSSGTSPARSSSSKIPTAMREVPKSAKFTRPALAVGQSSLFFSLFFIGLCGFVGIENALEMVHLVLEDVCKKTRGAACESCAFLVVGADGRFLGARDKTPETAKREASFVLFSFFLPEGWGTWG